MAHNFRPHPDFDDLIRRLRSMVKKAKYVSEVVFRSTEPTYATEKDLLLGGR
jgi:hypothetical protein